VMSAAEINTLAQGGLIEVGAHTVTHTRLSDLTPAAQRTEIVTSKTQLEAILNHPVTSFAYPFGRQSDYTAQTVALIREAGFDAACSNFMGLVTAGTDRYQLPRGQVQDITGEELARRLAAWFAD
jgi:peptidoglycan/xylan/chitin deacetylase (PgdA/CDA1 family)